MRNIKEIIDELRQHPECYYLYCLDTTKVNDYIKDYIEQDPELPELTDSGIEAVTGDLLSEYFDDVCDCIIYTYQSDNMGYDLTWWEMFEARTDEPLTDVINNIIQQGQYV